MKAVMMLFLDRSLVAFLGALTLVAMVWFGGQYLGMDVETRALISTVILGLWFVFFVVQQLNAAKNASQIEKDLKEQGEAEEERVIPSKRGDIKELQSGFDQALKALRGSKMGKRAITALPWYMIIGPPASGKTTLLRESSLHFPSMNQSRRGIRGLGGTRNCDWWFNENAIMLDTAGRYTTETEDREEWLHFLSIIRRGRKRSPINGVIVAISLEDLIGAHRDQLEEHAENIRERIDELTKNLHVVFPVYLMFTKCDMLPGFVEFFGDFSDSERAQVWGATMPELADSVDVAGHVCGEFDKLYERLSSVRIPVLVGEPRESARDLAYQFPLQFAELRDNIEFFFDRVFRPNPYQENPRLRGFYFCSGTQEGRPMDQLLSQIRGAIGVQDDDVGFGEVAVKQEAKAYFVDDLFLKVVFPDQGLARSSGVASKRRTGIAIGVVAASVVTALGVGWTLSSSFGATEKKLRQIGPRVAAVRGARPDDLAAHKALGKLRELWQDLQNPETTAFRGRQSEFARVLKARYAEGVKSLYAQPAARRILAKGRDTLGQPAPTTTGKAQARLAHAKAIQDAYRGVINGEPSGSASDDIKKSVIADYWLDEKLRGNTEARKLAGPHADWYFSHASVRRSWLADATSELDRLVEEEIKLCTSSLPKQRGTNLPVPSRLVAEAVKGYLVPTFPIKELFEDRSLGRDVRIRLVAKSGIPKAYRGRHRGAVLAEIRRIFELRKKDLPDPVNAAAKEERDTAWALVLADAEKQFAADAARAWRSYLAQVDFQDTKTLKEAIRAFQTLGEQLQQVTQEVLVELEVPQQSDEWLGLLIRGLRGFGQRIGGFRGLEFRQHLTRNFDGFFGIKGSLLPALREALGKFEDASSQSGHGRLPTTGEHQLRLLVRRCCRSAVSEAVRHIRDGFADYARSEWASVEPRLREVTSLRPFVRETALIPAPRSTGELSVKAFKARFWPESDVSGVVHRCWRMAGTLLDSGTVLPVSEEFELFVNRYQRIQRCFWPGSEGSPFGMPFKVRIGARGQYSNVTLLVGRNPPVDGDSKVWGSDFDVLWSLGEGTEFRARRSDHLEQSPVTNTFSGDGTLRRAINGPWGFLRLMQVGQHMRGGRMAEATPAGYKRLEFQFPSPVGSSEDREIIVLYARASHEPGFFKKDVYDYFDLSIPASPVQGQ